MPPPSSRKKPLTPEQIALLTKWVKESAHYEEHWSFVKPERGAPPAVKQAGWVKNPIDNFVLAKLETNGLAPEPEADPRTLLRRVTLDLTGLPPTPEEVAAFVADKSPDAYEKAVDRLLASPHYGEHEARYWLDAARYAETVGLHYDEPTSIFPYRDYVIRAFNDNKPFDRFTDRAGRGRPAAQRHAGAKGGHGLHPLRHFHERGRQHRGRTARRLRQGSRGNQLRHLHGPDPGLLLLPRP